MSISQQYYLYVGLSTWVCLLSQCWFILVGVSLCNRGKKKKDEGEEKKSKFILEREREREKKGSQIIRYKVIVTVHTYMHSYHNKFGYLQNYTRFNMCIFYIILCKVLHFLYFRLINTSALVLKFYIQYLHTKSHIHNPKPPQIGRAHV